MDCNSNVPGDRDNYLGGHVLGQIFRKAAREGSLTPLILLPPMFRRTRRAVIERMLMADFGGELPRLTPANKSHLERGHNLTIAAAEMPDCTTTGREL